MASASILQDPLLQARHKQSVTLSNGRALGYAEFGSLNKDATTILVFHGWPGSRLESAVFHFAASELNVRIIGIDRPGIGLSSPQPKRKLLDWPVDVRELVRHLKLERYYIIGVSAGGPHALACAHERAENELLGVGIVSGPGPWALGTKGASIDLKVTLNLVAYAPWLVRYFMNSKIGRPAQDPDPAKLDQLMRSQMKNMPPADLVFAEKYPAKVDIMIAAVRESFTQGADPNVKDGQMLTSEWGFDLKDIKVKKVLVWQGTKDVNVPVERGRYLAEHIPQAILREYEGDTHITIHEHATEMLRDLVSVSTTKI
ncbi:uncharacterized protein N7473_000633 [Penicillium subrubescens]|uniref:AB hydrolase-1 domain-containing protein n=1 Tax=Penicillium subrubescens TaxID=1316194 RepID=A0A1Q5T0Y2_9EURO|nr:uncharacterized protein N7473_000633 [Penicillium subrubescens]KAJ5911330.1 hypothetical protein N7473_000633 [Penicillium subrubescens]OKO93937.1 hypothetical protein PENSUB_12216 [Penicillium subrubescens]